MQQVDLLIKSITLLYRERQLPDRSSDSRGLVREVLNTIINPNRFRVLGGESSLIDNLKDFILDLLDKKDDVELDSLTLVQTLEIMLVNNTELLPVITRGIVLDLDENSIKKYILNVNKVLNSYMREVTIKKILSSSSYKINNARDTIEDTDMFVDDVIVELEKLRNSNASEDPAVLDSFDGNDAEAIANIFDTVKAESSSAGRLISGWQELNNMTQGGFRRGEFVIVNALQHKYKSGFVDSLFAQLAMNNKPILDDPKKKPLLLFISMEDDLPIVLNQIFKYLYYNENSDLPDLAKFTSLEISNYIKERVSKMGYHYKMVRVNPTEWTYRQLFNMVLSLEKDGYELHGVLADYLAMIPTIGCNTSGPMGTDLRDMFRRVRNFMAAKKILFITPHQLSTDSKQLIRQGIPDTTFVTEIKEKGYTSGSKQLDQEVDLELYIHIARVKRQSYLTVARGKHRGVLPLAEEDKFFMLPFPKKGPIPEDIHGENSAYNPDKQTDDDEGFDL